MIEPKEKPCKGTGLAKGYGCGKLTKHRIYGLGKMCGCYSDWLLNSENGKIKLQKSILKASKPRKELEQAKTLHKDKNSLQTLKNNVKIVCHKYIKERDKGKPCISCGEAWHSDFQAGHYFKAELYSTLIYNEDNIFGQCMGCNLYKEGNLSMYAVNLPLRIGKERFEELNRLASIDKSTDFKWDRQELIKIRDYYNEKLKEL